MIHPDRPDPAPQAEPDDPGPSTDSGDRPRRRWPWFAAAVLAAAAIFALAARGRGPANDAPKGKAAAAAGARAVPVVASTARKGDVGVYLTGLGTVTPLSTVTIRSRVDGELVRVAFREGELVQKGDLLAEIDPRPFQVQLEQAEGQKAKDEAALTNALVDLNRYQVLIAQDSIPRQQLDTQKAMVDQLKATIQTDQGQIDSARLNLTYSRITAPVTGRVGLRLVDPGNIVHANDANGLLVITQVQPIAVIFTIPADQLPEVLSQMRDGKHLTVDAYDRDLKTKLATGTLSAVDNQIDQTTGTVRLKATFGNEKDALFPNQFVNARLLVDTLRQTVIVPAAAIQRSPQSTFVYAIKPDQTVEMRPVVVQRTEGEDASIQKGLSEGDVVVVDGVDKLQPGAKVSVAKSEGKGARKAVS